MGCADSGSENMPLAEFIEPRLIDVQLSATNRQKIISDLAELLVQAGYVQDKAVFVNDVMYRESLGETGIGDGVAIPHGKSVAVTRASIAIGRTESDVEWPSLDGEDVNIVFLIAVPAADQNTTHMRLLQQLARMLAGPTFIKDLREATEPGAVISLIEAHTKEKK